MNLFRRGPWNPQPHIWPAERRRRRTFALLTVVCFLIGAVSATAYMRNSEMASNVIVHVEDFVAEPVQSASTHGPANAVAGSRAVLVGSDVRIIDGDTVRIRGEDQSIRLVGFNTGETSLSRAACPAEVEAGKRARSRLREIVNSGIPTVIKMPCACRPGTQGTKACNYGRACGRLIVDGRDVGDILVSEGLAAPYTCGAHGCPRPPRPWC